MSFSRLPKRIAGPGFHVNVRYDDETVAKFRASTDASPLIGRVPSAEVYDVKEMELLVYNKQSAHYYDGYTHCFSAVNGWYDTNKYTDRDQLKEYILDQVKFAGVAVTEYIPTKAYSEQGFVSQIGGVVTLINEGTKDIKPGQKVQLSLNLSPERRKVTRDKGIPREKVRFCIEPADDERSLIKKALMKGLPKAQSIMGGALKKNTCLTPKVVLAMNALNKAKDTLSKSKTRANKTAVETAETALDTEIKKAVGAPDPLNNLPEFLRAYRQVNDRVIGKALGSAQIGDRVEVLLQPRHAY